MQLLLNHYDTLIDWSYVNNEKTLDTVSNMNQNYDNISFITLTNTGYIDYTLNCLESLKRINSKIDLKCYCIGVDGYVKLRKQGFNNTVFIQLASEISEADERSSYQLFGEMLYNFTKSGENIIFIDFRDLENIQNLRNDLSLGHGLSTREITSLRTPTSLNEFIRYPFYMRSDVIEKIMFRIKDPNKNLFSLLKEFSIKTN
jgi:hypothetical protein